MTVAVGDRSFRMVDPGGRVGSKVEHGEPYERQLLSCIRERGYQGTALDVGAHVGNHALYLAAICGMDVHAIEPSPESFTRLEYNVSLNPGLDITLHHWAAGAKEGTGRLMPGQWVEFDPSRADRGAIQAGGAIPVHTIDDMLDIDDLAVVKVDVEGTEPAVLQGAVEHLRRCRPVVFAETHTRSAARRITDVLAPLGYSPGRAFHMGSTMQTWEPG